MKTLKSLFRRFGCNSESMDERIYLYLPRADKIDTLEHVQKADKEAEQKIAELLEYAELLKEYRKTLFDRAQEICAASYRLRLKIQRTLNNWRNGKKFYTITLARVYEADGIRDINLIEETYEGKERAKALKRFEELRKTYPNVETIKDIDKKQWER